MARVMPDTIETRRRARRRWVGLVVAIVAVVFGWAVVRDPQPSLMPERMELGSIPEGVSAHRLGDTPVFLVRRDRSISVFLTNPQHLPGENRLWWCPNEGVFASPTHGELFGIDGRVVAGPAVRGLSRFAVSVRGAIVYVNVRKPVEASSRPRPESERIVSERMTFAAEGSGKPWDSGPGSFCQGSIRSDQS